MVLFDGMAPKNSQVNMGGIGRHEASDWLARLRQAGVAFVNISPVRDAAARDIASGDVVRIYNGRGACLAGAVVTDAIRPGVIQLATGAWFDRWTRLRSGASISTAIPMCSPSIRARQSWRSAAVLRRLWCRSSATMARPR
jgi:hypothetical protein